MFRRLADLPCVAVKGPPVNRCRWFSFVRAAKFHSSQMFQQLVLLSHYREAILQKPAVEFADDTEDCDEEEVDPEKTSVRKEWAKLKQSGENALEVAIRMIGPNNIELQQIFVVLTEPVLRIVSWLPLARPIVLSWHSFMCS